MTTATLEKPAPFAEADASAIRRVKVNHPVLGHRIAVEVADLGEPYGTVARWGAGQDVDGRPRFRYYRIDPDRNALGANLGGPADTPPPDEVAAFEVIRRAFGTALVGADRSLDVIDPLRTELQAFDSQFPAIASAMIEGGLLPDPLSRTPVPAGFPEGLWLVKPPFPTIGAKVVQALERFARHDWGCYGTRTGRTPDPLEEWGLRIQPRRVRNEAAASSGWGVVMGAYRARSTRRAEGRVIVMSRLVAGRVAATMVGYWSGNSTPFPAIPGVGDPDDALDPADAS